MTKRVQSTHCGGGTFACAGTNLSAWAHKITFFEVRAYRKRKGREARFNDELVEQLAEELEKVSGTVS